MKISQKIIEKILNDNVFSIELAKRLGNQQQSILGLARRNSRNLTLWEAGKLYKEQGFTMKFTKNNYLRKIKTTDELIKITEENGQRAVSARELHLFLGVGRDFSNWIKGRIEEYGFIENQDYMVFAEIGENSNGGRPLKEYALTLDMAKELSMVEKTERGKQARRYFIEMEKLAKQTKLISTNKNKELQKELFELIRDNLLKGDMVAVAKENNFNFNTVKSVMYYSNYSPEIVKALYKKALSNKNQLRNELETMVQELKQ